MITRKNYFIKKRFQTNFALKFSLLLFLEVALIAGLFIYISGNTLTTGYVNSVLTIEKTSNYFLFPMAMIMLITAVGIGLAGMIVFILLSHRIAGPLYRFEMDLAQISQGDLTKRINTRKNDQLVDIKEALNAQTATFDERITAIKGILEELKTSTKVNAPENTDKIQNAVKKLSIELDRFKVTSGPKE